MARGEGHRWNRAQLKRLSKRQLIELLLDQDNRLTALEEALGLNSGNSSKPSSKDTPDQAADRKKERAAKRKRRSSGRKPGGQPGHPKQEKPLVPEEEVDHLKRVAPPEHCGSCGGDVLPSDEDPLRYQSHDLPEIPKPVVSEVQLLAGFCPCCQKTVRSSLPAGIPRGGFGPRVQAMVGYLSTAMNLSDRKVKEVLAMLFGFQLALGSVANLRRRAGEAVAASVEEAKAAVACADAVHADETSWRQMSSKAWVWTFVTSNLVVFLIRPFRNAAVVKEMLGEDYSGTVISDRYSAYAWLVWRQVCWSHLLRDFERIADRPGDAGRVGRRLQELGKQLFQFLHRFEDGELAASTFRTYLSKTRVALRKALQEGLACDHGKTSRTCREILKVEDHLWRFAQEDGVEPTNNVAERAIRHLVIWRKIRLGTQSVRGSLTVERLATVYETLKKQGRDFLGFLTDSVEAQLHGTTRPSLVPAT